MTTGSANLNVMIKAARKAARGLVRDFGEVENLQVSMKGAGDFVSRADIKAESIIKDTLMEARPAYSWLAEEGGEEKGADGMHRWIVDPLDGTTNFLHGLPHWAVSIALERKGEIIAAVVYDPAKDEMFTAEKGQGAWMNDRRLRVSGRREFIEMIFATGVPFANSPQPAANSERAGASDASLCRRSPLGRCGTGPRLCGGWPLRRVLGTGHSAMGCCGRNIAGQRGWWPGWAA